MSAICLCFVPPHHEGLCWWQRRGKWNGSPSICIGFAIFPQYLMGRNFLRIVEETSKCVYHAGVIQFQDGWHSSCPIYPMTSHKEPISQQETTHHKPSSDPMPEARSGLSVVSAICLWRAIGSSSFSWVREPSVSALGQVCQGIFGDSGSTGGQLHATGISESIS